MDRTDITPALVTRLLGEQFPRWAHLPVSRVDADGIDNTPFRLGDTMSVRMPTGDWYSQQVEKEQRWCRFASDMSSGVPLTWADAASSQ